VSPTASCGFRRVVDLPRDRYQEPGRAAAGTTTLASRPIISPVTEPHRGDLADALMIIGANITAGGRPSDVRIGSPVHESNAWGY
jgi:hypothetical protein